MRSLIKGVILLFIGPVLFVGPAVFPGGNQFFNDNPLIGSFVGFALLALMGGSSYYFGKEWVLMNA